MLFFFNFSRYFYPLLDIQIASSKLRSQYAEEIISSLVNEPLVGDRSQVHYQYDENL